MDIEIYDIDLTGLTALTAVRTLKIRGGIYATCNPNPALSAIGATLTNLSLQWQLYVNLPDIANLCPSLEVLTLVECRFLPLTPDIQLDPQLLHFKHLISIYINQTHGDEMNEYVSHYSSLKTIRLIETDILTNAFVR